MFHKIAEGDIYAAGKDGLVAVGSRTAILVRLWYDEGQKKGIRFVKLEMDV